MTSETGVKQTNQKRDRSKIGAGKPGPGRPKGSLNKATLEIREFARGRLSDPRWIARLDRLLFAGRLPPAVVTLLFYYGFGKPKDLVDVTVAKNAAREELMNRLLNLPARELRALREQAEVHAKAIERLIADAVAKLPGPPES